MSAIVLAVQNLGKKYIIGHQRAQRYTALRDVIADNVKEAARRLLRRNTASAPTKEEIWALRDVSFELKQGERLGIIGRNGAGKSTLLKILSRITEPTTGRVRVRGRVASLLEVGTGFHPELTGRENIYLNGAILGMSRAEIQRKFDEIVAFAEVEKFLDTPVKRYSSGMYVRLAFAVAAHLEPEILVVDEVLAVGDAAFQKKCLGKMSAVAEEGRTVLFVSHSMEAIAQLCTRGIHIAGGEIACDGRVDAVVASYIRSLSSPETILTHEGIQVVVGFLTDRGESLSTWNYNDPLSVDVRIDTATPLQHCAVDLAFYTMTGSKVFAVRSDDLSNNLPDKPAHKLHFVFRLVNPGLVSPELSVDIGIRANRESRYLVWWQRIQTLSLTCVDIPVRPVSDSVIWLPCEMTIDEGA